MTNNIFDVERHLLIERMTNWQRNQMLKACKGKPRDLTTEQLKEFADMPHWKEVRE